MNVLKTMVFSPLFLEEEIEIEKKVILNELIKSKENKYCMVNEKLIESFYNEHPLSRNIIGTWQTIQTFNHEVLMNYYIKVIKNADIVISVSGNIDDTLLNQIRELFEDIPRGNEPFAVDMPFVPSTGIEINTPDKNIRQNYLSIGYPTLSYDEPKLQSLMVYNHILGVGRTSFLMKNVRDKLGLAYSVGSATYLYRESGLLIISFASDTRNDIQRDKSIVINLLIDRFREELTSEQISIAKTNVKSKVVFSLENGNSRMLEYGKNVILNIHDSPNGFNTLPQLMQMIDDITSEDVHDIHDKLLSSHPTVSMITKEDRTTTANVI